MAILLNACVTASSAQLLPALQETTPLVAWEVGRAGPQPARPNELLFGD